MGCGGHVQSLLSGYKRINIRLNPECWQGRAKAAAQYSLLRLSLHSASTILELWRWRGVCVGRGERGESGPAFDVLIGRGVRTAAALGNLPGDSSLDS